MTGWSLGTLWGRPIRPFALFISLSRLWSLLLDSLGAGQTVITGRA